MSEGVAEWIGGFFSRQISIKAVLFDTGQYRHLAARIPGFKRCYGGCLPVPTERVIPEDQDRRALIGNR